MRPVNRAEADPEARLLERIRADEPGAFDEFVSLYGDKIYGFGLRMCGAREDAQDILQETLIAAYRSLRTVDEPKALRGWLYRVAANACLMKRRKGKFEPKRELSLDELMPAGEDGPRFEIPDTSTRPDEAAVREELRRKVRRAIRDLPPHYRIVVVMRDMEGLSTEETATALELPAGTVKMRLHRARLSIRKALAGTIGA